MALTRRCLDDKVIFLYSDGLNCAHTAEKVKKYFSPHHASITFYPPGSRWINCTSYMYQPHSNECGPRTMRALAVMALHPSPDKHILLPFVHPNLAQISRWWVAKTIESSDIDFSPMTKSYPTQSSKNLSLKRESIHYAVASLRPNNDTLDNGTHPFSKPSNHLSSDDNPDSEMNPSTMTQISTTTNTVTSNRLLPNHPLEGTSTHSPMTDDSSIPTYVAETSSHSLANTVANEYSVSKLMTTEASSQKKNRDWTSFRPFIPHDASGPNTNPSSHPGNAKALFENHLIPFSTQISIIDHTKILRICVQNTQHLFQLYVDAIDISLLVANVKSFGASNFVLINPNINWCNINNWACTKQSPLKSIFQLIPMILACYQNISILL